MTSEPNRREGGPGGMFRRILVGYDGSAEARRALHVAVSLAADVGGDTHVLLVVRPPAHVETPDEQDRAIASEREDLSRGLAEIEGGTRQSIDVQVDVAYSNDPAAALAAHAEERGYDVIVVGTHGREQITHRGIGQSLVALLRSHPCPILVV